MNKICFGNRVAGARKISKFIILLLLMISSGFAQSYYVHRPDAQVNSHGSYSVGLHLVPSGGLLASVRVGFFDRFQIGLSYGGGNIIGTGQIDWYDFPGVQAKVNILDEYNFPLSWSVGFDSQHPVWSVDINQTDFYTVVSKELVMGWVAFDLAFGLGYEFLGANDGFHLYAIPGIVVGDVFSIYPEMTVYPQREPDNGEHILNLGIGFGWEIYEGTGAEFLIADILTGFDEDEEGFTRTLRFQITQEF